MAQKTNRQAFGSVRKLPSGRYQARYRDQAGRPMTAPTTFATKRDALEHLAGVQADRMRGVYRDHRDGAQLFAAFAAEWIETGGSRGKLAPRTAELYADIVARDLATFGPLPLSAISPAVVRRWYGAQRRDAAERAAKRGGTGEARTRQSYALLKAILGTAVRDRLIGENPCAIVGAGIAQAPERPYLAPAQLAAIVEAMPENYALAARVMFGAHLRLGELVGLERGDYDRATGSLTIERQVVIIDGRPAVTATKTGTTRVVALPPSIAALVDTHLSTTAGFPRSPMFTAKAGEGISRSGVQRAWTKATKAVGVTGFHVHDVRHAGLTLAAQAGATTRELMARAGHRTSAAAMTYQHAAEERNALLAGAMDALSGGVISGASGTAVAGGEVHRLDQATESSGRNLA